MLSTVLAFAPTAEAGLNCQDMAGALFHAKAAYENGLTYNEAWDVLMEKDCDGTDASIALCRYYTAVCYIHLDDTELAVFTGLRTVPVTKYEGIVVDTLYAATHEGLSSMAGPTCQDLFGAMWMAESLYDGGSSYHSAKAAMKKAGCSAEDMAHALCVYFPRYCIR